ncbi:ShlB/FhaC/HecB family hemolysin secretion/activation protein [Pseudanabaena sp. BC1403]|uniref:ShlB/FhaC/HecB family hemolysin secretion/activation protein n=1 Tax=Pseudanabaena sp. BC1403 TaxID=2043171 RepID=UPI000CD80634|nr:ShlB/FhaC/HecB family hemolysin secretion/activation protein [Pseudanabaena sp. BC1403]
MTQQTKDSLKSLLWTIVISSGYFVLPSYADTIALNQENTKTSETEVKVTETAISQAVSINQVKLIGNTVLNRDEIDLILQSLQDKSSTLEQVKAAAEDITQLYISNGYLTSRAQFDPQDPQSIVNGVAQIKAIEGQIERIDVVGTVQTNPDYVRSRVELGISKPFNANAVEDQLRLLKNDPLFKKVTSTLKPSTEADKSLLVVQVEESKQFGGSVSFDNYSPIAVGSERMGVGLSYRNLTGLGDLLSASYYRSTTGGSNLYDFSYSIPVNPMNGTVAIRYAPNNYRITDPDFATFNIRGASSLYDIVYRQPLIRNPREEFALSLGFAHQTGQTFLFENLATPFGIGPDANGVSTTSVFRFGQDYTLRDNDGTWSLRSQFNLGTGLFNATYVTTPNAGFFSWIGQAQRVQMLGSDALLIASFDSQLSANPLLPSQQFTIGGGQSLRGFRQNARSGDNGIRFSLETRLVAMRDQETNRAILQIAPFIDLGAIWNHGNNPTPSSSQNFLAAGGIGLIIEPIERFLLRVEAAIPFVNLQGRGNNLQDTAVHFSVSYQF